MGWPPSPHPPSAWVPKTPMPGLRRSFLEHVSQEKSTSCSRKAPVLSPGFSERYQEDQVSGGRMREERNRETQEGRSLSSSHSQFLLFFPLFFQTSAGSWCKPSAATRPPLQLLQLPAPASRLCLCWLPWRHKGGLEWSRNLRAGRWNRARCIFKAIWESWSSREEPPSLVNASLL